MSERELKIKELEAQIADLKKRFPAHSIKPVMVERLEELEEELCRLQREE
nr:histidine kinase [Desulfoscipio gibsoniae]